MTSFPFNMVLGNWTSYPDGGVREGRLSWAGATGKLRLNGTTVMVVDDKETCDHDHKDMFSASRCAKQRMLERIGEEKDREREAG